ncbi:MAG: hypothetical protein HGA67_02490 [Candidatus Yonathbacteria bacterium]|nr:hypothetical protein [Candidatus Yonathbacteria bacterium]
MASSAPFINLEYVFYKIYTAIFGVPPLPGEDAAASPFTPNDGGLAQTTVSVNTDFLMVVINGFFGFITLVLLVGVVYVAFLIWELKKKQEASMQHAEPEFVAKELKDERWEMIQNHIASDNPNDWRVAIMEADNILDDMVKRMGYEGEDLGGRLRAVEPSDFLSIQSAWEAHKVRNKIAHDGLGFEITQREAKRVIGLYEKVFREFEYI